MSAPPSPRRGRAAVALSLLPRYVRQVAAWRQAQPDRLSLAAAAVQFPLWCASLWPGASALDCAVPWMTFNAIAALRARLRPWMTVYEYGAGGSTLFFAARVRRVVSVDHDPEWVARVGAALARRGAANVELVLAEPDSGASAEPGDPADPDGYASADERWTGRTFRRYAATIDAHPDASFDVVLVDGRARPSCLKHAWSKVRLGGTLILDNADRTYYTRDLGPLLAPFDAVQHPGPCPFTPAFELTTFYERVR